MDETDKFLKDYILNKQYIEKDDYDSDNSIDKEDEEREEKDDIFEQKYNFRFEEPNGTDIACTSKKKLYKYFHFKAFARTIPDSIR